MTQAWFDFDIRTDPVFQEIVKPFIENQMAEMAAYDRQRQAINPDIKYIFHEHAERVAKDVRNVAARLGQPEHVQEAMYWAMLAHDLGKKTLPVQIWDSEGKPTGEDKTLRRSHAERGLSLIDEIIGNPYEQPGQNNEPPNGYRNFLELMRDVMTNHHEHIDGSGHHGLRGEQISTSVRLCCIVEGYDGYTIERPHDKVTPRDRSPAGALHRMRTDPDKGAKMYDLDLLEAFTALKLATAEQKPAQAKQPGQKF
ncbi:MAG: response regulator receiver (CheY-like) modulated metal dependent phosphohydrolase [Micavibrio sp.]|nr:response regulator receiver (CheY-like) modulated metal dependent phosphohydrolase [Micavibrio sp.]